jgi:glycerol-3-phosphate acyltransferase PlsX
VGLLNVGTEEHKGRPELHEAHGLISQYEARGEYSFVGFVEGSDIPRDKADVIVTDGFTGNVALKTGEGTASLIADLLKQAFDYSQFSRLSKFLAMTSLQRFRKRIDPRRVNGGVFLGLNGTVVKSHGSADETGVSAAIGLAVRLVKSDFSQKNRGTGCVGASYNAGCRTKFATRNGITDGATGSGQGCGALPSRKGRRKQGIRSKPRHLR